MKILWLFLVLVAGTINASPASDHHPNQTQIREWVNAGDILSLDAILQRHPLAGELLDAEMELEDDQLVYELKWIDQQGQRHETYIDATTGEWLQDELDD